MSPAYRVSNLGGRRFFQVMFAFFSVFYFQAVIFPGMPSNPRPIYLVYMTYV